MTSRAVDLPDAKNRTGDVRSVGKGSFAVSRLAHVRITEAVIGAQGPGGNAHRRTDDPVPTRQTTARKT